MTLPALPEALARACEVLPERFKVQDEMIWGVHVPHWHVFTFGEWLNFWPLDMVEPPTAYALMLLEAACREECAARGWEWMAGNYDQGYRASVIWQDGSYFNAEADTPALALCLALLSALEAQ